MCTEKSIHWVGTSYKDLLDFPTTAKQDAGYQIHRVQNGFEAEKLKIKAQLMCLISEWVKEKQLKQENASKLPTYFLSKIIRYYARKNFPAQC